jgi:hypothetical protein
LPGKRIKHTVRRALTDLVEIRGCDFYGGLSGGEKILQQERLWSRGFYPFVADLSLDIAQ